MMSKRGVAVKVGLVLVGVAIGVGAMQHRIKKCNDLIRRLYSHAKERESEVREALDFEAFAVDLGKYGSLRIPSARRVCVYEGNTLSCFKDAEVIAVSR